MGGTKEATIKLDGAEGESVCEVYGGKVRRIQGVECVGTWELYRDQSHSRSREGGYTRNLNESGSNK